MGSTYSLYEAKAKFSEVIGKVRRGQRVTITHRGKKVAEIRPVAPKATTIAERVTELQELGVLSRPGKPFAGFKPLIRRPGGLKRFLAERE